jgi:hypothetical protein
MPNRGRHIGFPVLLLALAFLGAQLHFCADLTGAPTPTHVCPVCSELGAAVVAPMPSIAVVALAKAIEPGHRTFANSADVWRETSPRAPPIPS